MIGARAEERLACRREVLASCGAKDAEIEELLLYNKCVFDHSAVPRSLSFPMEDEPFVAAWERYCHDAAEEGVAETLRRAIVQFRFPIAAGISQTEAYLAATRRGVLPPPDAPALILNKPERLCLTLHSTPAGRIPVLITADREDFVTLVRALSRRNEPALVPDSMGACVIAGFNNWDRVRELRRAWEDMAPAPPAEEAWQEQFRRIIPRRELYQDRFLILSDGPYSAVPAAELGLQDEEWRRLSVIIRREHESAHYFTRRVFSSMKNNLIDELIADYMGLVGACGWFRAAWFLHFMGLEGPEYRQGARLENYRGDPPLSGDAFRVLQRLVVRAAQNLERFDREQASCLHMEAARPAIMMALTELTLEEIASDEAETGLTDTFEQRLESLRCEPLTQGG